MTLVSVRGIRMRLCLALGFTSAITGAGPLRADYPNKVLDSQPTGFWRFNDSQTPEHRIANSSDAGVVLDGVFQGGELGVSAPSELGDGTLLPGIGFRNTAYDVGANDSYVDVNASPLSGLSAFTLSGWFNPRAYPSGLGGLIGQHGAIEFGFNGSSSLEIRTAGGGTLSWPLPSDGRIGTGIWTHLAAVGTGSQLELFVNGEQVASGGTQVTTHYGTSDAHLRIGSGVFANSGDQFQGTVDELAIWGRALPADLIHSQFDASLGANKLGDFNGNDRYDIQDVNSLILAIYNGTDDILFDVTKNGLVDMDDFDVWVKDVRVTFYGDANLDGEFSSADLVFVFQRNEYEDGIAENSGWDEGDWNGDLEFTSADFVVAFSDGGFEKGPAQATAAVPEPGSLALQFALSMFLCVKPGRRDLNH